MPSFTVFQPTLTNLVQDGIVARELHEGLDSDIIFHRYAKQEKFQGRIGSRIIIPKTGRKAPVTVPLTGVNVLSNLDNGLTPSSAPTETYEVSLAEWGDTTDVDIIGELLTAVDNVTLASRNNGVQAAQSMDRLAKIALFGAYFGGNTFVRPDLGSNNSTTVHVDDIRGFQKVQVNGQMVDVSVGHPLPCFEYKTSAGGVFQSFNVTGAVADSPTNYSLFPGSSLDAYGNLVSDGISGTLTIAGATSAPVAGDAIVAANAQKIIRPLNKPSSNLLTNQDVLTLQLILAAQARLKGNNVPVMPDGTYHLVLDPFALVQLFQDSAFLSAYTGRFESEEYQSGQVFELLGVTFIPTTEAYVQPPTPALGMNCTIRRSVMMGRDCITQANFDGLDMYLDVDGMQPIGGVMLVDGIAQIVRPPIDRMLRLLSLTWTWVGSFTCQTDGTATPIIIPTASNALYKRAIGIETGG